jgi:hypothetical protein
MEPMGSPGSDVRESSAPIRACLVAGLAAFCTLFAQVAVHRLVSAKLLNNFAFFALSLTMLGFAASGAWLSRHPGRTREPLGDLLALGAALFGVALIVATAALDMAPPIEDWGGSSRASFALAFLSCVPFGLLYSAAFAGAGLILGVLLSAPSLPTRRLYGFDLVGSAAGAFAIIPAVSWLGAEGAALAAGGLLLVGVVGLVPPRGRAARLATALAAVALLGTALAPRAVFRMRYPRESYLGQSQAGVPGFALEYVAWDPIARIEVSRVPPPDPKGQPWPSLFGPDRSTLDGFRLLITQNNNAFTYAPRFDGSLDRIRGLRDTIYAAAYQAGAKPAPKVLVIGVGGGIDVLTALSFEASSVVGVEVNAATLDILRRVYADHFRSWVQDPRVSLVHDDGRHHLASLPDTFDVLQLSGVDSVSGTPGAAHVFSESYLYTAEALDLYLSRLSPDGVLNIMRPEPVPPRDMLRLLATTIEAMRRRGVEDPAQRIVVVVDRTGQFVSVLAAARPFRAEEVSRLVAWTRDNPYLAIAAAPGLGPLPNAYQAALSLAHTPSLRAALSGYPWDVLPVTDDRPFFFRSSRWSHLWPGAGSDPGPPITELGLLVLLGVCAAASVLFVLLPLRAIRRPGGPGAGRAALFFGSIGLGYMAIEMAFIQKLGLLLGHPNHALSVVLALLLLATGVGSLASARLLRALGGSLRFVSYALALLLLGELLLVLPRLGDWVPLSLPARVAISAALIVPVGMLLGTFFPVALERLKSGPAEWVPWAWGLNGMASVVAPVLGVAVSMTFGISTLLLLAVPVYLVAGFTAPSSKA